MQKKENIGFEDFSKAVEEISKKDDDKSGFGQPDLELKKTKNDNSFELQ